jgi:aspartate/methionine/tyrosine aminotransferase
MKTIEDKFLRLGIDNAPGQEGAKRRDVDESDFRGDELVGVPVDFSHGDVNHGSFEPAPGSLDAFVQGFQQGGEQAYTEYKGSPALRDEVAEKLAAFTKRGVSGADELIFTPGTQSALFLAIAATVNSGDKVAVVQPDYFANRKLVEFFGGEVMPVRLDYLLESGRAGLNLDQLDAAFKAGTKVFLFSNPSNPTGAIYSKFELDTIAALANRYNVTVIVDQLYARLLFADQEYVHLRGTKIDPKNIVTIMGPSKTESLSGFRLGVAFGASGLIDRMEKLQAIVSLRAPGYCQSVLRTWFSEPDGWLADRIASHQAIRDDLLEVFRSIDGVVVRTPQAGSYLFPKLPKLNVPIATFVRILHKQAGVVVTPGTEFSPHSLDSIRLNFSQNRRSAVDAVKRSASLIDRYRF